MLRFVLISTALASTALAQTRGLVPEDYFRFQFVSDPKLSPDGKQVAFTRSVIDKEKNRRVSSIWLVPTDGGAPPRQITASGYSSNSPRWSPDGKQLAFLSTRDGARAQIQLLRFDGGEARQLTKIPNGASNIQWSPDGKRFVFLSRTGPSDRAAKKTTSDVKHYKNARYKFNDSGWFDDKRSHLWIADAVTGEARQLTDGDDWNDLDPQWSPDAKEIAFVSDRTGKEFDFGRNTDIWVIPAEGGALRKISTSSEPDNTPRWSPNGSSIAYIESTDETIGISWKLASCCAPPRTLAPNLDFAVGDPQFDGENDIYFSTQAKGETLVYKLDVGTGLPTRVTPSNKHCRDYSARGANFVAVCSDFEHFDELYTRTASGPWRPLTSFNNEMWKSLELASVERVPYRASDGWDVEGFLVKPLGWQAGKKYPMILSIHGGPASMYGTEFNHEFQGYAARGWAVFYVNPRGSSGYGVKFQRGVDKNWGGGAYTDIMTGVEAVLSKNPWIDRTRLGVTGGSYGGFMTNWITSHTNIFAAAATLRCISNFISDEGTRDAAFGHDRDFGGDLFQNFDLYWEFSPLKHAKNVKTPTLVMHSEQDLRTPLEQGEQWFRALRHFGVTAEIVIFPRENHNLTRTGEPAHLVESLNWQQYWFRRFLDGDERAKRPTE